LNKADIPEKYIGFISSKYPSKFRADIALCNIELYIGIKENEFRNALKYSSEKRKILINHIKNRHNYNLTARLYRRLKYVLRQFINLLSPKGTIITFSGVDGAGKTTVINEVIDALKNKYRKEVVYLHQRPGILPILSAIKYGSIEKAEKVSADALPRQGTNRSKLSSILRFSYYYIDYVIGQAVVRFKYLSRDKVVIYDRYYFDFINDAKRSNINLNRSFIKKMYAFITKPAYNFYLYNEPRVILKRKKELSSKEISELNKNYKTLFSEYVQNGVKGKYIQLKNDELPETINRVMNQLKNIA
jgi:thymidylate kinase